MKEIDQVIILDGCRSFVDLCIENVAQLHSSSVTCKVMQELGIPNPPSDWVHVPHLVLFFSFSSFLLRFFFFHVDNLVLCCCMGEQGVVSKPYFFKAEYLFSRAQITESNSSSSVTTAQDTYKGMHSFSDSLTKGGIEDLGNVFSHVVLSTLFVKSQKSNRLYRFDYRSD